MKQYNTYHLLLEQKLDILHRAKKICRHWWVDILDCDVSFHRQRIDMPWEDIIQKLDKSAFSVIDRGDYLEVGFREMAIGPEYFLWVEIDHPDSEELTADLEVY